MQEPVDLRRLLTPGDRRTVGRVAEVVDAVQRKPEMLPQLLTCLCEGDEALRMRAADALEKVSRVQPEPLQPFVGVLLSLFAETKQPEVLWHLAVLLPRLRLNAAERQRTVWVLERCLDATSSLVRTFALQGLTDLALQERSLIAVAEDRLREAERTGTPAMKARSRRLLRMLQR